MTERWRAEMRELLAAATPGAWWTGSGEHWGRDVRPNVAFCGGPNGANDARLIVAMKRAMPMALDELDAAEAENRELREKVAGLELETEAAHERIAALEARIRELTEPRGIDEWTEEDGPALWWKLPVVEPPYSGSPLNDDFPDYVTHWTPVALPSTEGGEG